MKCFWVMAAFIMSAPLFTGGADSATGSKLGGTVFAAGFLLGVVYCCLMQKVFEKESK